MKTYIHYIQKIFKNKKSFKYQYTLNEMTIIISEKDIVFFSNFLKFHTNSQYKILSDLCAVDYLTRKKRFEIVYHFLSIQFNSWIWVKLQISEKTLIQSITSIYECSNWFEWEIWDLFGISIINHPDLWWILTDYGFIGHPLWKDFPVSGYFILKYQPQKLDLETNLIQINQIYWPLTYKTVWAQ